MSEELDRMLAAEGQAAAAATAPFVEAIKGLSDDQLRGLQQLVQQESQTRTGPDVKNMSDFEFRALVNRYVK